MSYTTAVFPAALIQVTNLIGDLRQMASMPAHPGFAEKADEALVIVLDSAALKEHPDHKPALRELRSLLHGDSTRTQGLQALESLVQVLFIESEKDQSLAEFQKRIAAMPPFLSRLWSPPNVDTAVQDWKNALDLHLSNELRYRHVLHPPAGPDDNLVFRIQFNPFTARILSLTLLPFEKRDEVPMNRRTTTSLVYRQDLDRRCFMLEDRLMKPNETLPILPAVTAEIIDRIHGYRPFFTAPERSARRTGGKGLTSIQPKIFERNKDYAARVLGELQGSLVSFEIAVAPDGSFSGFRYRTPDLGPEQAYEVGILTTESAAAAEVKFELFRHATDDRWLHVPDSFVWKGDVKPNAFQRSALVKWKGSVDYRVQAERAWSPVTRTGRK